MDYKMSKKKLMLIGGINNACEIIERAHELGLLVGVVDYNHGTHARSIADENYYVDIKKVEDIVSICKENNYDGIITNFIDFALPFANRIARQAGLPAVFTEDQIRMSTNKKYFKEVCQRYGVLVPIEYRVDWTKDLDEQNIVYPVIVKPVDGSGSKGIRVCKNADELLKARNHSLAVSRIGDLIVEQYISDTEINLNYIIQNGEVTLSSIHDRYFNTEQTDVLRVPDVYIYPSRYTDLFLRNYNKKIISMLKGLEIQNGSLFMQACVKDDKVYIYEVGMRFNGCKTYHILAKENGYDTLERMIKYAITGDMGEPVAQEMLNPRFKHWYATLSVLAKPCEIHQYIGIEKIKKQKGFVNMTQWYFPGEKITEQMRGTLAQTTVRIDVMGNTRSELIEAIREVYAVFDVVDSAGNSVLLQRHNLTSLENALDYEL